MDPKRLCHKMKESSLMELYFIPISNYMIVKVFKYSRFKLILYRPSNRILSFSKQKKRVYPNSFNLEIKIKVLEIEGNRKHLQDPSSDSSCATVITFVMR